jgi:SAM-dependent methyltransferase
VVAHSRHCILCSGEARPFFEGTDAILACRDCGVIFDLRSALGKAFYEDERQTHVDRDTISSRKRNVHQRVGLLKKYLTIDSHVLDIGCGEGLFLKEVKGSVGSVFGVEPTPISADYSRRVLNLDVRQGMIEDIEFPGESFDIVTMFHVLEHVENPASVLKKIRDWIKPGGCLVIEVPNIGSPTARHKGSSWELIYPEHRFHFNPRSIKYLLEREGFKPLEVRSRDFDQYRVGIGTNLRKLGLVTPRKIQSCPEPKPFKKDGNIPANTSFLKRLRRGLQVPLKVLLGWLVMRCNCGDYLFVVARKK